MELKVINIKSGQNTLYTNERIANFLYEHLEQYGDETQDILKCLEFVFDPNRGGNVILSIEDNDITGAVILNNTGMSGYIPENLLVYIAVHQAHRGKGLGKKLMKNAIDLVEGNIALHVEPNNPAKHLYEKLGFENKYLEMRFINTK